MKRLWVFEFKQTAEASRVKVRKQPAKVVQFLWAASPPLQNLVIGSRRSASKLRTIHFRNLRFRLFLIANKVELTESQWVTTEAY